MNTISASTRFTETAKLLLNLKEFPDATSLHLTEDHDRGNLFGLFLICEDIRLPRKVAELCGCPANELPDNDVFENSSFWDGGKISFRTVADEVTALFGEFFDEDITLGDLRWYAAADMARLEKPSRR